MLLGKLKKAFTDNWTGRALGAALAFGAVATPIVAIPGPANDAYAQSGQVARVPDSVRLRDDMTAYSKNPNTRGIGVFINLQANAPMTGQQIGEHLRAAFGGLNPPVPVEYRVHQSRGTATEVTFYVKEEGIKMTVTEIVNKGLSNILNLHRGAWLPETASLESNKPSVTR